MMNPLTNRLVNTSKFMCKSNWRRVHTSRKLAVFYEPDRKSGFPNISDYKEEKLNPFQRIYRGYFQFIEECGKLKEEIKNSLQLDPPIVKFPGEVDVQWKFNGDPKILDKWVVTCDSDYNHGYSKATVSLSPTGAGVFSGIIDTRVPQDGKLQRAGFCNLRSVIQRGPFKIEKPYQWFSYTHLILRVRGDGHSYMINLHLKNDFDVTWADLHSFPLYTRGGPYWQYVKIPFSKFYLGNRGKIQDSQLPLRLWEVMSISFTAAGISGPFKLEIDYIGVENDPKHYEQFAYEMYKPPHPYYI
ncbi:complex I intermediate-associated protein 30, mitochondrial [Diachasma alloeum]|uniref:complex I intermediate-associated protein 30, mitochondrial n=1 Tax=Diachasma alloeum TaxID=454923 RepID=UPI0007384486|nr:complex I intermediate-associated protein 30, mitochondrial [Diachasma alloeum]